ncbi:MAG: hypothetical protein KDJ88_07115 [Bauldia sp.]|nr:hypothetical protein [Bauldia sp.]
MIDRRQLQNRPPRARPRDDEEPIITYSRLEADRSASPHDFDGFEPASPLYEAVEVPRATRPPPRDAFVDEPELRAERDFDLGIDPLAPEPRPRRFRLLIAFGIGAIVLIAGVGVLLATLDPSGPVTATTDQPAAPPLLEEPADAAAGDDVANTAPNIRQIPIVQDGAGGAGEAPLATAPDPTAEPMVETVVAPDVVVEPPAPRLRPTQPATETVLTDPGLPAPPATIEGAPASAAAPAAESDEDFLRRIEQTLNRVEQSSGTPAAAPAPVVIAPPATIPAEPEPPAAADTGPVLVPADELVISDPAAGDDTMMDGGGHFDIEMEPETLTGAAPADAPIVLAPANDVAPNTVAPNGGVVVIPALPGAQTGTPQVRVTPQGTVEPLLVPPAPIGVVEPPPQEIIVEQAPAPPPARQPNALQRLFPRLLPVDPGPAN